MNKPILELKDVSARFGSFCLESINMTVNSGDFVTIMGPCGSGKTKILELIAGACYADKGHIFFKGNDITNLPPYKRKIGIMYQKSNLFPHLSVKENITYGLRYQNQSAAADSINDRINRNGADSINDCINDRINETVELLKLEDIIDRPGVIGLSGGENQKVSMARTLILKPELILLDEPFSSLDMGTRREFTGLFKFLNKKINCTFIYVSHLAAEIKELSNMTHVISRGRLIQSGPILEIETNPVNRDVKKIFAASDYFERLAKIENRSDHYAD
jgi:ABC-type sugar transport system ATPase subunit